MTLTHTDDLLAASPKTFPDSVPGASIPATTPPFQINNHLFTLGTSPQSSTTGTIGAYEITSATQMSVGLAAGTGVTQSNVPKLYTGNSDADISVNFNWSIGATGFPQPGHFPGITYSFALGGVVGTGAEASDEFKINMTFFDTGSSGVPVQVGALPVDQLFTTPGAFTKLVSGSVLLNSGLPLPKNSTFEMTGTIDFLSKDPDSPSNINIDSGGPDGAFGVADFADINDLPEPGCAALALFAGAGVLARRNRGK
jgi:hypothetical protein